MVTYESVHTKIQTEIADEWVSDPCCLSTIDTMLKLISPNFGVGVCVSTCEQAFSYTHTILCC